MFRQMYVWFVIALIITACQGVVQQPSAIVPTPVSKSVLDDMTQVALDAGQTTFLTTESNKELFVRYEKRVDGSCFLVTTDNTSHQIKDATAPLGDGIYARCSSDPGANSAEIFVPQTWWVSIN